MVNYLIFENQLLILLLVRLLFHGQIWDSTEYRIGVLIQRCTNSNVISPILH